MQEDSDSVIEVRKRSTADYNPVRVINRIISYGIFFARDFVIVSISSDIFSVTNSIYDFLKTIGNAIVNRFSFHNRINIISSNKFAGARIDYKRMVINTNGDILDRATKCR